MSFEQDVDKWVNKTKAKLRLTKREIELAVGASLVRKSPVGDPALWEHTAPKAYVPGTFKANWVGNMGSVDYTTTDETDPTGELSLVNINRKQTDQYGVFYISNSLPYAQALEDGHSSQAPAGMVGLTVLEFEYISEASIVKVAAL